MINSINKFKKIILGSLIALAILPFFFKQTSAFETPNPTYQFQFEEAIKSDEMNLQSFVNETIKAIMGSIVHFIIGGINPECSLYEGEGINNCLVLERGQLSGLIPSSMTLFSGIYQYKPASGIQYFADLGKNLGITKSIYAEEKNQFNTFESLKALQSIWKRVRDLAYLLFVLILVGMGFAIMFRMKISPQAVITIQSALPKIVLALILITFSYAIVGLMLDISLFLNSVISSIFVDLFKSDFPGGWIFSFYEHLSAKQGTTNSLLAPFIAAHYYGLTATLGFFIASLVVGGGLSIIILLIIGILLAIAYLRALWVLIRAFAMIIINLVFAPIRIIIGVFPGTNGIADWFRDLLANIAILPGMLCLYFLGHYLILKGIETPIEMASEGLSGFGIYGMFWMLSGFFLPIIGIFILLMIPKVSDIIQSFITKKPFQYGTAIGEVTGAPARAFSTVSQTASGITNVGKAWTERFGFEKTKREAPAAGQIAAGQIKEHIKNANKNLN